MEFLPKNYEEPQSFGNYAKLEEGLNQFRILASAIIGWEWWEDSTDDSGKQIRKPMRVKTEEEVNGPKSKHFWAFPVYNYKAGKIQILEVTQKSIKNGIKGYIDNPKWGDPRAYDIVINRVKTGNDPMDVEYYVQTNPKEELDPKIGAEFEEMKIDMEALYSGGDPFANVDKIDVDQVLKDLTKGV